VIIGTMALIKMLISKLGLPPVWEAVAHSLDYGLGFVLIHILHLTVATKQPAMTAATLAAALDGKQSRDARLDVLVELAVQVSRTQWISIAGNVSIGFITALAIAMTAGQFLGWHPVDPVKGAHLLHDLHPWQSLALFHAAIAGVFLFLSGLISGYYDNQSLYHRVPERLRRVKWLRSLLGEQRLARLADYIELNLGALAGNFLFGCMLGSTPIIGSLLGLPLDIRHVAFASANLAYGLEALEFDLVWQSIAIGAAGVILIGLTNLMVSFSLAMRVALRSRGIQREETSGLSVKLHAALPVETARFLLAAEGSSSKIARRCPGRANERALNAAPHLHAPFKPSMPFPRERSTERESPAASLAGRKLRLAGTAAAGSAGLFRACRRRLQCRTCLRRAGR
jgi:site-specific recombinase